MTDEKKVVAFRVDESMRQFLRKYGFDRETSMGGAVRLIVKQKMQEQENAQTEKA